MKNKIVLILALALLPLATISAGGSSDKSIMVSGQGVYTTEPDMVTINVGVSELGSSSDEAMAMVKDKISLILIILDELQISPDQIETQSIYVSPENRWHEGQSYPVGQRASQNLSIKAMGIDSKPEIVNDLLVRLTAVNNIQISGLQYDLEDKEGAYKIARERAFADAAQKADELASLSGSEVSDVLMISENSSPYYSVPMMRMEADYKSENTVPAQSLDIRVDLSVTFQMK